MNDVKQNILVYLPAIKKAGEGFDKNRKKIDTCVGPSKRTASDCPSVPFLVHLEHIF